MTGFEIYQRARLMLGEADGNDAQVPAVSDESALCAVNQIGEDLCNMPPIKSIFDEIPANCVVLSAFPYGVAMLISLMSGDGERNRFFCEIYNAKRAVAKSSIASRRDRLPRAAVV